MKITILIILAVGILTFLLRHYWYSSSPKVSAASDSKSVSCEVALIGDISKRDAFQALLRETNSTTTSSRGVMRATTQTGDVVFTVTESSEDPFAIANQLLTADIALLVVDSTQGPLPVTREQLIVARQATIPCLAVYFSRTATLQTAAPKAAPELLELEEKEMRELLSAYEMKGETATVLFDSDVSRIATVKNAKGTPDLMRYLRTVTAKRPRAPRPKQVSEFLCYYYLLSNPEANGHGVTLADRDQVEVWMEGASATGTVRTSRKHEPGDNGEFELTLASPLPAYEASRVLFARNGSVVGVGVVKNIVR
jgi:translation elongation factor EF-Tu-like GTPase